MENKKFEKHDGTEKVYRGVGFYLDKVDKIALGDMDLRSEDFDEVFATDDLEMAEHYANFRASGTDPHAEAIYEIDRESSGMQISGEHNLADIYTAPLVRKSDYSVKTLEVSPDALHISPDKIDLNSENLRERLKYRLSRHAYEIELAKRISDRSKLLGEEIPKPINIAKNMDTVGPTRYNSDRQERRRLEHLIGKKAARARIRFDSEFNEWYSKSRP